MSGDVINHEAVEVVIVGAGAGGAITALTLAEAGIGVTCLEQGTWTAPADRPHASPDWEWLRLAQFATSPNIRRWQGDYPVETEDENTLMWNGVGGGTGIWTAAYPRFRPSDFRKGTEHGLQPDWPFTYEDLEPWFDAHDALIGVSGVQGNPGMPPRSAHWGPPVPPGPVARLVSAGLRDLGWHHWPTDTAILSRPKDGRPACNCCSACQSGCSIGAMHDTAVSIWPKALAHGAELRTQAKAMRIETDRSGRATGVLYLDTATGERHWQPAETVVVAGNGVGTPRLLLMSASKDHPTGLANSSDQVGRNLMHHGLGMVEAWLPERTDIHMGNISSVYICEEFAETDPARGFVNGVTIQIVRMNGAGYQAIGSHAGFPAPWGKAHHRWFREHWGHGFAMLVIGDDLPLPDNRVTLSPTAVDANGLPGVEIAYRLCANDRRQMDFGLARAVEIAQAANAWEINVNDYSNHDGRGLVPAFHLMGTCRMGTDPRDSVVDARHRSWDVPNLYIMDGSVLPTGGAVNPTATISAVVMRAASLLRDSIRPAESNATN